MKNKIFAISAAPAAIPPKPNSAATMEIIKNMAAHLSIIHLRMCVSDVPRLIDNLFIGKHSQIIATTYG